MVIEVLCVFDKDGQLFIRCGNSNCEMGELKTAIRT